MQLPKNFIDAAAEWKLLRREFEALRERSAWLERRVAELEHDNARLRQARQETETAPTC